MRSGPSLKSEAVADRTGTGPGNGVPVRGGPLIQQELALLSGKVPHCTESNKKICQYHITSQYITMKSHKLVELILKYILKYHVEGWSLELECVWV